MIVAVTWVSSCSSAGLSGCDLVLVGESAEDLFPADLVLGEVDLRWPGVSLSGCELARARCRAFSGGANQDTLGVFSDLPGQ